MFSLQHFLEILMGKNNRTSFWTFLGTPNEKSAFHSLQTAVDQQGEIISRDPISHVKKITVNDTIYYIKIYHRNGKGARKHLGRGRIRGEWENLLYFQQLGIPTPRLIAYGHNCYLGQFKLGALITTEIKSNDLATLAKKNRELFKNKVWLSCVLSQCADYTKRLHEQGFVHWDLKWRNILVSTDPIPQVYFFDCPLGRKQYGWLQKRGIVKDLACLDKVAIKTLSRSQRLRFFKLYRGVEQLSSTDKKMVFRILSFFANEEH